MQVNMSQGAELRRRLASVNSAEKLIDAMRLVAAARIRSSSQSALRTRPFAEKLQAMLASLLAAMERDGHDALHAAGGRARGDAYGILSDDRVVVDDDVQRALMDRLHLAASRSSSRAASDDIQTVCIVVIGADKGFCGTYNRDVIARAAARARFLKQQGLQVEFVCVGRVASSFFYRNAAANGVSVRHAVEYSGSGLNASTDAAAQVCDTLLTSFISGEVDRVEVVYTRFVSILSNTPSLRTLIPLTPSGIESLGDELFELTSANGRLSTKPSCGNGVHHQDERIQTNTSNEILAKLQLDPKEAALLLNAMLPMYMNSQLVRILRESLASEHASRMNAMSAATDNARDLAERLKIRYNKERQARITKEIIEVSMHSVV